MISPFSHGASLLSVLLAACAMSTGNAVAQEVRSFAPLGDILFSSDTDGFQALRTRAGAYVAYENPWRYTGFAAQSTRYNQGDFSKNVQGLVGQYRDVRRDTLAGIEAEAGVVRVSGRLRPIGDATWRTIPVRGTAIDLMASADLVETPKALDRGIGYTFLSAGLEQQIGDRFTMTGLAGWQSFSDGNARTHLRARLIWLAMPEDGVTLQLRFRQYATRSDDVGQAYFNPPEYRQLLGVATIRKRTAGWILSGAIGAGPEGTDVGRSHVSYLAEARAEGTIAGAVRLVLKAGYNRSAGYIDSPKYAYRLFSATFVVPY
ncbi:MAG: hypothetical protein H7315_16600 [Herminiimonas sp.]|nr:hypothetical protein [Herminiimonas sp.]